MPKPDGQVCPLHTSEFVQPKFVGSETAEYEYTCTRDDHPVAGPFTWAFVDAPVGIAGDSLGLGLGEILPAIAAAAIAEQGTSWIEYGLIEAGYGAAHPDDWALLLRKYGHTHYCATIEERRQLTYTASKYLARSLGALGRQGALIHVKGPGTGRWSYNQPISYYALPPGGDWADRTTWEASGQDMSDYMPETRPF